jgi:hypothetical protein
MRRVTYYPRISLTGKHRQKVFEQYILFSTASVQCLATACYIHVMKTVVFWLLVGLVALAVCCVIVVLIGRHWTYWQLTVLALCASFVCIGLRTVTSLRSRVRGFAVEKPVSEALQPRSVPVGDPVDDEVSQMIQHLNEIDRIWARREATKWPDVLSAADTCYTAALKLYLPWDEEFSRQRMYWQCIVKTKGWPLQASEHMPKEFHEQYDNCWNYKDKWTVNTLSYVLTQTPFHNLLFRSNDKDKAVQTHIPHFGYIPRVEYDSTYIMMPTAKYTRAALTFIQSLQIPLSFEDRNPLLNYTPLSLDKSPEDLMKDLENIVSRKAKTMHDWVSVHERDSVNVVHMVRQSVSIFQSVVPNLPELETTRHPNEVYEYLLCHPYIVYAFDSRHLLALVIYEHDAELQRAVQQDYTGIFREPRELLNWLQRDVSSHSKKCRLFATIKILGALNYLRSCSEGPKKFSRRL